MTKTTIMIIGLCICSFLFSRVDPPYQVLMETFDPLDDYKLHYGWNTNGFEIDYYQGH